MMQGSWNAKNWKASKGSRPNLPISSYPLAVTIPNLGEDRSITV
jgi:hypothetical protein